MSPQRRLEGRGRDDLFSHLVPQPGPRDPDAVTVWRELDDPTRQRLRRAATDPALADEVAAPGMRLVVADLARQRAQRQPLDLVVPLVTGLLVLSTVWGFGRAVVPESAGAWLVAGLLAAGAVAGVGVRRIATRRRDADAVGRLLTDV